MHMRHLIAGAVLLLGARAAMAQTPAELVAQGDSLHVKMDPVQALAEYRSALTKDSTDYEALWKASREAVDLAEFDTDKATQKAYYAEALGYARRAVAVDSTDAEGHFNLARSLGRVALTLGAKDRVRYAKEIRHEALEALKYDSLHAGALHVLGRWNAEIMRLSGFSRFFAKTFLGAGIFNMASWDSAVYYMKRSVEVDSMRIVHHLDYAEILRDRDKGDDRAEAIKQLQAVIDLPATDYNDKFYKQQAERDLARLQKH